MHHILRGNNHPTFALLVDPMLCMCSTRVFTPTHFSKFAGSEVRFRETLTAAPSSRKPGPTCADLSRAAVHSNAQRCTAMLSYERKLRWLCLSLQINLWRLQQQELQAKSYGREATCSLRVQLPPVQSVGQAAVEQMPPRRQGRCFLGRRTICSLPMHGIHS